MVLKELSLIQHYLIRFLGLTNENILLSIIPLPYRSPPSSSLKTVSKRTAMIIEKRQKMRWIMKQPS